MACAPIPPGRGWGGGSMGEGEVEANRGPKSNFRRVAGPPPGPFWLSSPLEPPSQLILPAGRGGGLLSGCPSASWDRDSFVSRWTNTTENITFPNTKEFLFVFSFSSWFILSRRSAIRYEKISGAMTNIHSQNDTHTQSNTHWQVSSTDRGPQDRWSFLLASWTRLELQTPSQRVPRQSPCRSSVSWRPTIQT